MSHRFTTALVLVTALAAPTSPAFGAQQTTVANLVTPTLASDSGSPSTTFPPITASGGRVVWSTYDASIGAWRLMQAVEGRVAAVPVPSRRAPFDVDLGSGPDGAPVAAYSRCRRYGHRGNPVPREPRRRSGCDIYLYSFGSGSERRLSASSRADEYWPSVSGSHVAFVRSDPKRAITPSPYRASLTGRGRARRLAHPAGPRDARARVAVDDVEMRGRQVAYTWTEARPRTSRSFIQLVRADGSLSRLGPGAAAPRRPGTVTWQAIAAPQITPDGVLSTFTTEGDPLFAAHLIRYSVGPDACGGSVMRDASDPMHAVAIAQDGDTSYGIDVGAAGPSRPRLRPGGTFPLVATTDVRYGALPQRWTFISDRRLDHTQIRSGPPIATIHGLRKAGNDPRDPTRCFFSPETP